MRRVLSWRSLAVVALALVTALGLLSALPSVAEAAEDPDVVIEGGGWGHGVGMSQYGAYGQAMDGRSGNVVTHTFATINFTRQLGMQWGCKQPHQQWQCHS